MLINWAKAGWLAVACAPLYWFSKLDLLNLFSSCKAVLHIFSYCPWAIAHKLTLVFVVLNSFITWFNTSSSQSSCLNPSIINIMFIWKMSMWFSEKWREERSVSVILWTACSTLITWGRYVLVSPFSHTCSCVMKSRLMKLQFEVR